MASKLLFFFYFHKKKYRFLHLLIVFFAFINGVPYKDCDKSYELARSGADGTQITRIKRMAADSLVEARLFSIEKTISLLQNMRGKAIRTGMLNLSTYTEKLERKTVR
jgi:hypothetical protein